MEINKYIDHTLLKQDASLEGIEKLLKEAKEYHFKSVCVNPCFVKKCHEELKDSDVLTCTVIGFPLGANTTQIKVLETKDAVNNGADEIDMVINVSMAKEHNYTYIENEIRAIKEACSGKLLKVILETCLLTDEEIVNCCKASMNAGADYVKTSTGFSKEGANEHVVKLMADTVQGKLGVKASGGVRTAEDAKKMIAAGATRIGASSGVAIVENF